MSTAAPRAYSYIRFSTPEQLKGDSLRRQLELSARYAREHGLVLDEQLTFRDLGVSAFDKSNLGSGGKLREFLDAVDQGRVPPGSFLLVESLDRLSRAEIYEALPTFLDIQQKGITIVTLADGMTYAGGSGDANKDFTSLLVSIAVMARAHEESLTKSRRLKAAWSTKRGAAGEKKLTAQCPAWVRLSSDRKSFELIPERVAVVRQIIELVRTGLGKGAIAKRLNERGVPTIGPPKRARQSDATRNPDRSWYESYIAKILRNRALIGEFQPHRMEGGRRVPAGEPVAGYFPRVVSDTEFALLQDLISERGRKSGGSRGRSFGNLFTGLVKCGYCGGSMTYIDKGEDRRGRRSRGSRFLVCHKAKRGAGCHYVPWSYTDFEEAFFRYVKTVDFARFVVDSNERGAEVRSLNDRLVVERAKRADLLARRDRLVEAIATSSVKPAGVLEKIATIEDEIAATDARQRELEEQVRNLASTQAASTEALEALRKVGDSLAEKQGDERFVYRARLNEFMRRTLERIILLPGGTIHSADEVERIKGELQQCGRYTQEVIDKFAAAEIHTTPHRHERCFVLRNREHQVQVIMPESATPDILDVLAGYPSLSVEAVRRAREKIAATAGL